VVRITNVLDYDNSLKNNDQLTEDLEIIDNIEEELVSINNFISRVNMELTSSLRYLNFFHHLVVHLKLLISPL